MKTSLNHAALKAAVLIAFSGVDVMTHREVSAQGTGSKTPDEIAPADLPVSPSPMIGGGPSWDSGGPAPHRWVLDRTPAPVPPPIVQPAAPAGGSDGSERKGKLDQNNPVRFDFENAPWPDVLKWLAAVSGLNLHWQGEETPSDEFSSATAGARRCPSLPLRGVRECQPAHSAW